MDPSPPADATVHHFQARSPFKIGRKGKDGCLLLLLLSSKTRQDKTAADSVCCLAIPFDSASIYEGIYIHALSFAHGWMGADIAILHALEINAGCCVDSLTTSNSSNPGVEGGRAATRASTNLVVVVCQCPNNSTPRHAQNNAM